MLILALDTTTRGGSVAVTRDDTVIAVVEGDPNRRTEATELTARERPGEVSRQLDDEHAFERLLRVEWRKSIDTRAARWLLAAVALMPRTPAHREPSANPA